MAESLDLIIVGAGPTGLACGIEAHRAGLKFRILEKGCLVNSLYNYPANMTFFTSRELLEIGDLPLPSVNVKPTRAEALEYYRRVAQHFNLPIQYEERVLSMQATSGGFLTATETIRGGRTEYHSRFIIVATGYYDLPNMMGVPGEDLPKVSHYAMEGHLFFGRKAAIIGGANSAAVCALDLYRHGAHVTIIHREETLSHHIKYWIRPDLENRIRQGAIRLMLKCEVVAIEPDALVLRKMSGETVRLENDLVLALTGYHPDFDLLQSAGVELDPETSRPKCSSETLESNVPGLYLAGVVISGYQTNEIFIENGRFHGKQIIADIQKKLA